MTALPIDLTGFDEASSFIQLVQVTTGFKIVRDRGLGLTGVDIDHDNMLITINGCLDPAAFMMALSRAYRRITKGPASDPAFHPKLRLIRCQE